MRGDHDRILALLEMCDLLIEHASDLSRLAEDPMVQAAAQRWIEVLGEAASNVSDETKKVQHVDNRPGHGGSDFDDTYKKDVTWDITFDITITDGQITAASDPKGTVTGTTSAQILSQPSASCNGPVGLVPDATGALKVPMTISAHTTPTAIEMELEGGVPLGWGFSPCFASSSAVALPVGDYAAYQVWAKDTVPRFSLSLPSLQLQTEPITLSGTWPFPPVNADYKVEAQHWTSQITVTALR